MNFSKCKKPLKIFAIVTFSLLVFFVAFIFIYSLAFQGKIYSNVRVADINVGGLTPDMAKEQINHKIEQIDHAKIQLNYQNFAQEIDPAELNFQYNSALTIQSAYLVGREGNFPKKVFDRLKTIFRPANLSVAFQFNKNKFNEIVDNLANKINISEQDATISIDGNQATIKPEKIGQHLETNRLKEDFIGIIGELKPNRQISLVVTTLTPLISTEQVQLARTKAQHILAKSIVLGSLQNEQISVSNQELTDWLEFVGHRKDVASSQYILDLELNQQKIKNFLSKLATKINSNPQDAKLTIADGRAVVWQKSQQGYSLDINESCKLIATNILNSAQIAGVNTDNLPENSSLVIKLPIAVTKPTITEEGINNLGIRELIAAGTTSYKGSPANRKYNIKIGSEFFNGALIKPGEEFSFIKNLGDVTEARGFKKELVIKEDATVPEVGGGLCQVSTTMFRAALNAGLKITERSNHRYRVSYYEPPVGLDATIYEPSPDLKFINDTPGYILIQSKISGNDLTFEFYGTRDGREVTISVPELYDYVNPTEPVYIDDPSLAPGEIKYKEKAHQGVKAKVSYTVRQAGAVINQQVFYSKYSAWKAIILRGPVLNAVPAPTSPSPSESPSSQPVTLTSPEPTSTTVPSDTPPPSPSETPTPTPS